MDELTQGGNVDQKKKKQKSQRTSLVVQWIIIPLPMQLKRVRPPVQEDSTCHNHWASAPEARALQQEKPLQWGAHVPQWSSPPSLQLEKAHMQQHRPSITKNKNREFQWQWWTHLRHAHLPQDSSQQQADWRGFDPWNKGASVWETHVYQTFPLRTLHSL